MVRPFLKFVISLHFKLAYLDQPKIRWKNGKRSKEKRIRAKVQREKGRYRRKRELKKKNENEKLSSAF